MNTPLLKILTATKLRRGQLANAVNSNLMTISDLCDGNTIPREDLLKKLTNFFHPYLTDEHLTNPNDFEDWEFEAAPDWFLKINPNWRPDKKDLTPPLKKIRLLMNLSVIDVGKRLDIDSGHVSRIERGLYKPRKEIMSRLIDLFHPHITVDHILFPENYPDWSPNLPNIKNWKPNTSGLIHPLKKIRLSMNLSAIDVGKRLGISPGNVSKIERGLTLPREKLMCRVLELFHPHITADHILFPENYPDWSPNLSNPQK